MRVSRPPRMQAAPVVEPSSVDRRALSSPAAIGTTQRDASWAEPRSLPVCARSDRRNASASTAHAPIAVACDRPRQALGVLPEFSQDGDVASGDSRVRRSLRRHPSRAALWRAQRPGLAPGRRTLHAGCRAGDARRIRTAVDARSAARCRAGARCAAPGAATGRDRARRRSAPRWSRTACRPRAGARCSIARSTRWRPAAGRRRGAGASRSATPAWPRPPIPRPQGQSAALAGTSCATCALIAKALGLRARAGQAPQGAGNARRAARGHRAARLRPQDQGACHRPRACARRWRWSRWSAPSATRSRAAWPTSPASPPRPAACSPAQLAAKPRDFGTDAGWSPRSPPSTSAQRRPDLAALRLACCGASSTAPSSQAGAAAPGRAPRPPVAARPRLVEPAPACRRAPRHAGCRPARSQRLRARGAPARGAARRRAGPATARPTSRTSGADARAAARVGRSPRSSSSACWPRRTAPASSRSPMPTSRTSSDLKELQDSAVVYKNTIFHFIRVDD